MTTWEQTIETIKTFAPAERRRLQQWLQEQERQDAAPPSATSAPPAIETVEQQLERFRKAMAWIREHRAAYLGQWVVLVGEQLISHGPDSKAVFEQAKAAGITVPFLARVSAQPTHYVDGFELCR